MEQSGIIRKLAAILAADVVGYSRLMGLDEVGTLNALKAHRRELVDPMIAARRGRIVKTTGDGLLLEFASVVDAVACAVAVQRGMLARNADTPEDRRIVFRVGINVGDIIIDGDDIFGDGVNVAARLESICEPGGVCISRGANEQVRDKLALSFADLGEQTVKNIARAIGVYGLAASAIAALPEMKIADLAPASLAPPQPPRSSPRWLVPAAAVLAAVAAGAGVFAMLQSPKAPTAPAPIAIPPPRSVAVDKSPEADELFWNSVRGSNDAAELRAYLAAFPNGVFKDLAKSRIDKLAATPPANAGAKPAPAASPAPAAPPAANPPMTEAQAKLAAILRQLNVDNAPSVATQYLSDDSAKASKALAVAPDHRALWRVNFSEGGVANPDEMVLERCQGAYNEPCFLVANGLDVLPPPPGGYARHDMPRLHYAGKYDPAQIPGVRAENRSQPNLRRYGEAIGPKAFAIHPGGGNYWRSGANQRAAEEAALAQCNDEPNRVTRSVPCLLYAVGDQVVLPQRSTTPLTPAPAPKP